MHSYHSHFKNENGVGNLTAVYILLIIIFNSTKNLNLSQQNKINGNLIYYCHSTTHHFFLTMIITCWLLFKPDNHFHYIFQEKEQVYSTDDHKAFPQIWHISIKTKTKCLQEKEKNESLTILIWSNLLLVFTRVRITRHRSRSFSGIFLPKQDILF